LKISKSQFIKGHQCPKALWYSLNRKDLKAPVTQAQQKLFDQGHEVGDFAKKLFPKGHEIHAEYWENEKAVELTNHAIKTGHKTLFEATAISPDGLYARIDILNKVGNLWDLIEVKSSTTVQEYHLWDLAAQRYAFEQAGYKIRKTLLLLIDNTYVKNGEIDPKGLLKYEDITSETSDLQKAVKEILPDLLKVTQRKKEPKIDIGDHCNKPFECEFKNHCWAHVPEYSVYNLCKGEQREDLLAQGILDACDIPDGIINGKKAIDLKCAKSGKMHIDKFEIKNFLEQLEYPVFFLDYETINPAVPMYNGTSPYKQTPFQFSCHIKRKKGADLEHVEFLHDGKSDPRIPFIEALIKTVGKKGTIVAYHAPFEKDVNEKLKEQFPAHALDLSSINKRFLDLCVPFKSRAIYHPDMNGSASLKSVLPVFEPGLSYEDLELQEGQTVSIVYEAISKGWIAGPEKERMMEALREYCLVDTLGMVKLIEVLEKLVRQP
jgi:CRISPR/Cas system-associated exonuclease Cas4 (RecB family)